MSPAQQSRLAIARRSPQQPRPVLGTCDDCGHDLTREDWEEYRSMMEADGDAAEWRRDPKPRCCAEEVICKERQSRKS